MNERKDQPWPPVIPTAQIDPPIPASYLDTDNDLARDNLENDIPEADLQDIHRAPRPRLNLQFKPMEDDQ